LVTGQTTPRTKHFPPPAHPFRGMAKTAFYRPADIMIFGKNLMKRIITLILASTFFSCSGKKDTPAPPSDREMIVSTIAGSGTPGYANANGTAAQFGTVWGVAADDAGNVFVGDGGNNCIRQIAPSGFVSTVTGGTAAGFVNGNLAAAKFSNPLGIAVISNKAWYVADVVNNCIRYITAGNVSTLAGTGVAGYTEGSPALFRRPMGVAVNTAGTVYVADLDNHAIRSIAPNGNVNTLAGNGTAGFAEGTGNAARFNAPFSVAVDAQGNVYVADYNNHRIRKITPAGVVSTLAGSTSGYQDGVGEAARFSSPRGVATDAQGNVYVADGGNHRIRKITPNGTVTTIAGSTQGYADGTALQAKFSDPSSVAVDPQGNIYVGDSGNYRVRKISLK